jgi:hypothetical protein
MTWYVITNWIWFSSIKTPLKNNMKAFPEQVSYIDRNSIFYIISVSTSILIFFGSLKLCTTYLFAVVRFGWYIFISAWSFSHKSVVFEDKWSTSEWKETAKLMKRMWWVQLFPGSMVVVLVGLGIIGAIFTGIWIGIHECY